LPPSNLRRPSLVCVIEFLDQINKASIVMLDEAGIVPHPAASRV